MLDDEIMKTVSPNPGSAISSQRFPQSKHQVHYSFPFAVANDVHSLRDDDNAITASSPRRTIALEMSFHV